MKYSNILFFFIAIGISLLSVVPLFSSGFFPMHDNTQIARVYEMSLALKDFQIPVRWIMNLGYGYGYPLFNYYAPLAYYVGGFFAIIFNDSLLATKIMMALGMVFAGWSMFFLARFVWDEKIALLAVVLYVFAPYHAVNLYVRGAVGELWAYAWIPLVFYGFFRVIKYPTVLSGVIFSLSIFLIIVSHNLTAFMLAPFIVIGLFVMMCFREIHKKNLSYFVLFGFLGILVAGFYWIPMVFEMKYTNVYSQVGGGANFSDHFVCPIQLWDSGWGFGGSVKGCVDGLSFRIGKILIVLSIVSLIGSAWYYFKTKKKQSIFYVCSLSAIFALFMLSDYSVFVWNLFSFFAFIQYPWRYLSFVSFFLSVIAAGSVYWVYYLTKQYFLKYLLIGIFVVFTFLMNNKLFIPQYIFPANTDDFTSAYALQFATSKISDEYMPREFITPESYEEVPKTQFSSTELSLHSIKKSTNHIKSVVDIHNPTTVVIALAPFPAWQFYINEKKVYPRSTNKGYELYMEKGRYTIQIMFVQTLVERAANLVSLIGILSIILVIIYSQRKKYEKAFN